MRSGDYRDLLVLLALVVFAGTLGGSFHLDDYSLFQDPAILSASGWTAAFRLTTTRPLTWLTFWLNYQLAGMSPLTWHLVDLALHAECVALLYRCLQRLIGERPALLGAALFALHPLQAETVSYVFARPTALATLLCLAALLTWLRGARWQSVMWFALALLAKEECVFFPFFLALVDWPERKPGQFAWRPLGAMVLLAALAGSRALLATRIVAGAGAGFAAAVTPARYGLAQGVVIWRYVAELFWPAMVTFDPDLHPSAAAGVIGWLALAAVVIFASRRLNRNSPGFWLIGALILLAASSSIFPADDLSADRRMYLPMIAVAAAAGLFLNRTPRWAPAAIAAVLVMFSLHRTQTWSAELSLWTDAVNKAPLKARPRIQLSRVQPPADAERTLAIAAKNDPDSAPVATEQGKVFLQSGHPDQALGAFGRAAALAPRDAQNWNNLGVAFASLGRKQPAEAQFRHALELDTCLPDARRNLDLAPCPERAP